MSSSPSFTRLGPRNGLRPRGIAACGTGDVHCRAALKAPEATTDSTCASAAQRLRTYSH